MIIYFTGTGNSQYVAESLADQLQDEVVSSIDLMKQEKAGVFQSDKPWVFVFPVYISTIAKIFADFLLKSQFTGSKDAYFVATCAGEMGASANDAMQICDKKGFSYKGIEMVLMPQNYIALFKMTPTDECERRYQEAEKSIAHISAKISKGESLNQKKASGFEYAGTKLVEKIYYGPFTKTKNFYASDECVGCGLCEKVCPLNNITMVNGKPKWLKSCVHCMACINRCPKQAIEYGKKTAGKQRYICKKYEKEI